MKTYGAVRGILVAAVLLIFSHSGAALAQEAVVEPQRRATVWTNPILFVFTWYTAEVEIRLQNNHTIGVGGSFLETDTDSPGDLDYEENSYVGGNVFYRYYPNEAFKGFFLGAQFGAAELEHKENEEDPITFLPTGNVVTESATVNSAGILVGYGWLLGDAQRIGVSIGIGANRFFGGDIPDGQSAALPIVRFNVGVAF